MPRSLWGSASRAGRGATLAELIQLHERLDATIGRVLDEFLEATELHGQYTVGTSNRPPAWWLGNAHTAAAERPLRIHLHVDASDRSAEPVLVVDIQGVAERAPQNVYALGHVLHRETGYRVNVHGSHGHTDIWPQATSRASHGPLLWR